jgi:hypothetical protein
MPSSASTLRAMPRLISDWAVPLKVMQMFMGASQDFPM